VRIKWGSLLSNRVVIEEITIDAPEVTYEGVLSKSNFSTILDNVQSFSSSGPTSKPGGQPSAGTVESPGKKFLIKEVNLTNGHVAVAVGTGVAGGQNLSLSLPEIHLKDIGKDSGGATLSEALSAIFGALNKAGAQAVAGAAPSLEQGAKSVGEAVGGGSSKALEGAKGLFK
jgi:hypothetical protein